MLNDLDSSPLRIITDSLYPHMAMRFRKVIIELYVSGD